MITKTTALNEVRKYFNDDSIQFGEVINFRKWSFERNGFKYIVRAGQFGKTVKDMNWHSKEKGFDYSMQVTFKDDKVFINSIYIGDNK